MNGRNSLNGSGSPGTGLWSSRYGFLLATLGAAVGLGNIWRFAYVAGENGGGAFVIVYVVAVIAIGWPLLIAELAIGRAARGDAVTAFERISTARPWRWAGWIGVVACIGILSYYPVVAGWVAGYWWRYVEGKAMMSPAIDYGAHFRSVIADPVAAVGFLALVMAATIGIVAAGVQRGIERLCTLLMPLFLVLLVLLAGYGLSLEGAGRAAEFLFTPDWDALGRPGTYLAAIGQAFFSIGLGMGVLVTYGSYVPARESLPRAALVVALGDTLIALMAGMMIFPAVFTYGVDPAQGPTLAFAALPEVFRLMPGGRWFAIAFFSLLIIAALTSSVALLEVPVAWAMTRFRWARPKAAGLIGALALGAAVPIALGYGVLGPADPGGVPLLDRIDHLSSDILLPLSGISIALVAGWAWREAESRRAADLGESPGGVLWHRVTGFVLPVVIGLVMLRGLGWI